MICSWLNMQMQKLRIQKNQTIYGGMISSVQILNCVEGWCINSTIVHCHRKTAHEYMHSPWRVHYWSVAYCWLLYITDLSVYIVWWSWARVLLSRWNTILTTLHIRGLGSVKIITLKSIQCARPILYFINSKKFCSLRPLERNHSFCDLFIYIAFLQNDTNVILDRNY